MRYLDAKEKQHWCPHCEQNVKVEIWEGGAEGTPHFAKAVCPKCRAFMPDLWIKKPENDEKRGKSSRYTPTRLNLSSCEICGRERSFLGKYETLDIHHKTPVSKGGLDEPSNLLVLCTACHRMAHWLRTYLNDHHIDKKGIC